MTCVHGNNDASYSKVERCNFLQRHEYFYFLLFQWMMQRRMWSVECNCVAVCEAWNQIGSGRTPSLVEARAACQWAYSGCNYHDGAHSECVVSAKIHKQTASLGFSILREKPSGLMTTLWLAFFWWTSDVVLSVTRHNFMICFAVKALFTIVRFHKVV